MTESKDQSFILKLNIKGKDLEFRSTQEVTDFLSQQRAFWHETFNDSLNHNLYAHIVRPITQGIESFISFCSTSELTQANEARFLKYFKRFFTSGGVPIHPSDLTNYLSHVKSNNGVETLYACLATFLNTPLSFSAPNQVKGVVLATMFTEGISASLPEVTARGLEDLRVRYEVSCKALETQVEENESLYRISVKKNQRLKLIAGRCAKRSISKLSSVANDRVSRAVSSIHETEAAFKEKMRLKAPVEYWATKAVEHGGNARRCKKYLVAYALVATFLSMAALVSVPLMPSILKSFELFKAVQLEEGAYIFFATAAFVFLTALFWGGRILTRLFLSQHHLSLDANERAVMALTYLALIATGAATEDERSIVLGSLFRPTSDGIVKDDGAPDFSPAAMTSKFGAR